MKYIAGSISDFIIAEIKTIQENSQNQHREIRIVLPSLPARVVLRVGEALEEFRLDQKVNRKPIKLIYKSAFSLGEEWRASDIAQERDAGSKIEKCGWYDEENHLTRWRNVQLNSADEELLAIVLVGHDRVTDQSSLADFYKLDYQVMWKEVLDGSFETWVENRLKEAPLEFEPEYVARMSEVLEALVKSSVADLVGVSEFLEQLDLHDAMDGRDAFMKMVGKLNHFKLPSMLGLTGKGNRVGNKIHHYLSSAIEFFNYGKYVEPSARKKALNKVDRFYETVDPTDLDPEVLGRYKSADNNIEKSLQDFVLGLKSYIAENDPDERNKLKTVDFVFLHDEVLEAKNQSGAPSKKPKKLSGNPLEVVLRAVWLTLGEFKSWATGRKLLAADALTSIHIQGDLFKHDCEGENPAQLEQNAHLFLKRIIGGLDGYLERQLSFQLDPLDDPDRVVEIRSRLCPPLGEGVFSYVRARSAEPHLKFTVTAAAGERKISREFIWRFPQFHPYRTMATMFQWFCSQGNGGGIPIFCIPHFGELMLAKDRDEVCRILEVALQASGSASIYNLLDAPEIDPTDKAVQLMKKLGYEYGCFIDRAHKEGLFSALETFTSLEKAFRDLYSTYLHDPDCVYSQVGPLLFKAFFVVGERADKKNMHWMWDKWQPSVAVTPLHPALLEMLYHQHAYLCESFVVGARQGLRESGTKWFNERRWADIEDLAQIQWPLHGTLRNEDGILDINVRAFGLIHLIGDSPIEEATLTTRLLLRYDSDEDDEITDEDLFRDTREARLVHRVLEDYRSLNPQADDGMAIAAYCSSEVQSLIAGIDAFLRSVFKDRREDRPYTLSLMLFAESQDDTNINRWIREWRERWEAADASSSLNHYRGCRISVANRMITRENNYAQFVNLLNSVDVDIAFLFQFIRAGAMGSRFESTDPYDHSGTFRMFPVLEKMCCSVRGGGHEFTRERVISNRQFKLGTLHSGVMARLKQMADTKTAEYVVVGRGDFSLWMSVVDQLHKRSTWVVCVDPSVDEHLIAKEDAHGKRVREIIGFGSGVGAHGEYNYTVSTEEYSMATVKKRVSAHVAGKLGPWSPDTCEEVAECVIKEAVHMAGMSLVKATGSSEYVRDFIAYALVRRLLPRDPSAFCDELISLDAFRHWFDSAPSGKRPDLLRLKANIEDGRFVVCAQLVECKLAQQSERHIEKAREQLENGLSHLISCFMPRQADRPEGIDDRPDQRYWWLQLHRLIASKGQVSPPQVPATITALEKMSDGLFSIHWSAAAVTFWTDSNGADIKKDDEWHFHYEGTVLPIQLISAGRQFIKLMCAKGAEQKLPIDPAAGISFSAETKKAEEKRDLYRREKKLGVDVPGVESADRTAPKDKDTLTGVTGQDAEEANRASGETKHPEIPKRVFLGKGSHGASEFYWEFWHPELANRHMLIFGTSGMGKTYTIQALLCELARCGQNSLIVDYTDGFHESQLEHETRSFLKPTQHVVKLTKVPINPFRRQMEFLGGQLLPEAPSDTAQRVAGVFSEVYELGDQQRAALYTAVKRGVELHGDQMCLSRLPELILDVAKETAVVSSSASSLISKIQHFVDLDPFGEEDPDSWENLFLDTKSRCHILQLTGYVKETAKLITEFSLIDLYWYYRTRGSKDKPRVIVLDEIQNLNQSLDSPLGKFLTEGRKFGISLIMATQTLSNFQKDERDRLFQAAHKLFFRPADTEVKSYAQILENATNEKADLWVTKLSSLKKGECYSLGPVLNTSTQVLVTRAYKVTVAPLASRL